MSAVDTGVEMEWEYASKFYTAGSSIRLGQDGRPDLECEVAGTEYERPRGRIVVKAHLPSEVQLNFQTRREFKATMIYKLRPGMLVRTVIDGLQKDAQVQHVSANFSGGPCSVAVLHQGDMRVITFKDSTETILAYNPVPRGS
jgi:hypothetical protein